MRWFAPIGIGLVLSVAACAIVGETSESSNADFSFGRPGRGRPPGQPVLADDDAAPPAPPQPSLLSSADDGGSPPPPPVEDAGEDASAEAEDAGSTMDPAPVEDAAPPQ